MCTSVNSGIDKDVYLGDDVSLTYPTIDTLTSIFIPEGPGALMFKTDLSRAYKQLFVDPRKIHMLAFKWKNCINIDKTLPFGLHFAAYLCQRTTNMLRYILKQRDVEIVNYIDDLSGADTPEYQAPLSYQVLKQTFKEI